MSRPTTFGQHAGVVIPFIGLFLLMLVILEVVERWQAYRIDKNPVSVYGVIMCRSPITNRGADHICIQFVADQKLYLAKIPRPKNLDPVVEGQQISITYAADHPSYFRVTDLLPAVDTVYYPPTFDGEVVQVDGGCGCGLE